MNPILVTPSGRSGTSLMMQILGSSPDVVIANVRPYEARVLSYYAHALRVLTAPADHTVTHPDKLGGDGRMIGSNPYTHPIFGAAFRDQRAFRALVSQTWPETIRAAFRECILEYYRTLATAAGKEPTYFAEKMESPKLSMAFAHAAFGDDVRCIFMVRDPRDLYCSRLKYFKSDPERAIRDIANIARGSASRIAEGRPGDLLVRYENLISAPQGELERLEAFLGVPIPRPSADSGHREHGTSASPEASIGRWRSEMPADAVASLMARVGKYMPVLGYSA